MLIVIDHDKTYTEDPLMWDSFLRSALERGHVVVCCTYRFRGPDNEDVEKNMGQHKIPIIYAAKYDRKWDALEAEGYEPSNAIWIDDDPFLITTKPILFGS